MVTTARATAQPAVVINNNGSIFHIANSLAVTVIPFCRNIPRQSNPVISHSRDIPARLAEKVNDTAPMLEPTANANIPAVSSFGGISTRSAKSGCLMILTRRIVAPMLVPDTLQRITLMMPTKKTVAGREKPTTIASQFENTSIQPVYESASTRMNCENAKGRRAYGNRRNVAENVGNFAVKAFSMGRNLVLLKCSFRYTKRDIVSGDCGKARGSETTTASSTSPGSGSAMIFLLLRRVKLESSEAED